MDEHKFEQVVNSVREDNPPASHKDVRDIIENEDWDTDEHRAWLDSAPVREIATWVYSILRDIESERN